MNLDKSIYSEVNISKKPALELLQAMGYTYLSPEECRQQRGSGYRVLLRDVLRGQLRKLNFRQSTLSTPWMIWKYR